MHRACEACTYFEADPNRDQGECRRHAPKHGTTNTQWPIISKFAWCGDYLAQSTIDAADAQPYETGTFLIPALP